MHVSAKQEKGGKESVAVRRKGEKEKKNTTFEEEEGSFKWGLSGLQEERARRSSIEVAQPN